MTHLIRILPALGMALAASTGVSGATAQDAYPAPAQTTVSTTFQSTEVRPTPPPNGVLLGSGLAFFAGAYAAAVVVGATNDNDADRKLFLPVVGPWLDLADRKCFQHACSDEPLSRTGLILDGAVQGVGVGALVASFFTPAEKQVSTITTQQSSKASSPIWVIPSSMGGAGAGLRVGGLF